MQLNVRPVLGFLLSLPGYGSSTLADGVSVLGIASLLAFGLNTATGDYQFGCYAAGGIVALSSSVRKLALLPRVVVLIKGLPPSVSATLLESCAVVCAEAYLHPSPLHPSTTERSWDMMPASVVDLPKGLFELACLRIDANKFLQSRYARDTVLDDSVVLSVMKEVGPSVCDYSTGSSDIVAASVSCGWFVKSFSDKYSVADYTCILRTSPSILDESVDVRLRLGLTDAWAVGIVRDSVYYVKPSFEVAEAYMTAVGGDGKLSDGHIPVDVIGEFLSQAKVDGVPYLELLVKFGFDLRLVDVSLQTESAVRLHLKNRPDAVDGVNLLYVTNSKVQSTCGVEF